MVTLDPEITALIAAAAHEMAAEVAQVLRTQQEVNAKLLALIDALTKRQADTRADIDDLNRLCSALGRAIDPDLPRPRVH